MEKLAGMIKTMKKITKQLFIESGKRGGEAGRGAAKKRPREHYQRMAALSAEKRRANKEAAK